MQQTVQGLNCLYCTETRQTVAKAAPKPSSPPLPGRGPRHPGHISIAFASGTSQGQHECLEERSWASLLLPDVGTQPTSLPPPPPHTQAAVLTPPAPIVTVLSHLPTVKNEPPFVLHLFGDCNSTPSLSKIVSLTF